MCLHHGGCKAWLELVAGLGSGTDRTWQMTSKPALMQRTSQPW